MKKQKNPGGKPRFPVEQRLPILELAIMEGMTLHKGLEKAEIPPSIFYRYLADHPDYRENINRMKGAVEDIAEEALTKQMQAEPTDAEHRKEIAELAKWILKRRKAKEYGDQLQAPQLPGGSQLNINLGTQNVIKAEDLTDGQLQRLAKGETLEQVIGDKVIANADKP